jgi:hypothetical protein
VHPDLRSGLDLWSQFIAGMQHARAIIFLSGPTIETVVWKKDYVARGGGLQAQKWCEPKPPLSGPTITCLYGVLSESTTWSPPGNLISLISRCRQLMKVRKVGETSSHYLNGKTEGLSASRLFCRSLLKQARVTEALTEDCMRSLPEKTQTYGIGREARARLCW